MVLASATALLVAGAAPGHAAPTVELTSHQAPSVVAQTTFSGADLFTGLLLGHGPAAEAHPELVAGNAATGDPQQQAEFVTQLVEAVDQLDPTFLDTFAADITSGNPVLVDRALQAGQEILHTALTDRLGASTDYTVDDQTGTCVAVHTVAVAVTVTMVSLVVNANAVVNANVAWNVNLIRDHEEIEGSKLGYEKWINQVATTLAA